MFHRASALICPMCKNPFEMGNFPRIFPCGHSVCDGCTGAWLLTCPATCPYCPGPIPSSVSKIVINDALVDAMLSGSGDSAGSEELCDLCEKDGLPPQKATHACSCGAHRCGDHISSHSKIGHTQRLLAYDPVCPSHPTVAITAFCFTCGTVRCPICVPEGACGGHDIRLIPDSVPALIERLKCDISACVASIPCLISQANAAVAEAAAVTARADDFTASVEAECDVLRSAIALAARKHTDPVTAAAAKLAQGLREESIAMRATAAQMELIALVPIPPASSIVPPRLAATAADVTRMHKVSTLSSSRMGPHSPLPPVPSAEVIAMGVPLITDLIDKAKMEGEEVGKVTVRRSLHFANKKQMPPQALEARVARLEAALITANSTASSLTAALSIANAEVARLTAAQADYKSAKEADDATIAKLQSELHTAREESARVIGVFEHSGEWVVSVSPGYTSKPLPGTKGTPLEAARLYQALRFISVLDVDTSAWGAWSCCCQSARESKCTLIQTG